MKLSKGVEIAIGARRFKNELPDKLVRARGKEFKDEIEKANKAVEDNAKIQKERDGKDAEIEKGRVAKKAKAAKEKAEAMSLAKPIEEKEGTPKTKLEPVPAPAK